MLGIGLGELEKFFSALEAPALGVHPEYCSRLRHRISKCSLCSEHCPTHAIEWTDSLKVAPDKCISCSICANVCPNEVFEARKPTNEEILTKVKSLLNERQEIIFRCGGIKGRVTDHSQENQSGSITVPCLARLDEAVLVGSVALGAKSVCLIHGSCDECECQPSYHVAEETVNNSNGILGLFGLSERIFISESANKLEEESAEPVKTSRREFFSSVARGTKETGAVLVSSVIESHTAQDDDKPKKVAKAELPTCVPMKRRLLLNFMRMLGTVTEKASETESPLFCQFEIDDNCNGCQMCAFFCPTGALNKFDEGEKAGVSFKISDCTACGLCQEVCYKGAVRLSHAIDFHKVINGDVAVLTMREGPFVFPWQLPGKD